MLAPTQIFLWRRCMLRHARRPGRRAIGVAASYVEAKVDRYRLGNSGLGANSRKTEERKPVTFGEAASSAVAVGDAAASKPITIASVGRLTTWALTSGGVINRANDRVSWQPLNSGTDPGMIGA